MKHFTMFGCGGVSHLVIQNSHCFHYEFTNLAGSILGAAWFHDNVVA